MKEDAREMSSPAKGMFIGKIREEAFSPYPVIPDSDAETIRMVAESIRQFMASHMEDYRRFDVEGKQPEEYIGQLKELGLFGLIIPEEFGGLGISSRGYARIVEEMCKFDASTSLTVGAHCSIGMKGVVLFGNQEQKLKYLPKLATGEMVAAFCLTESGAGSDAASIKTSAVKNSDGSWTLNGEKIWITNGAFADFFTVFARTDTPGGKISAFLVERSFAGVYNGPKEDKMGIRASATTTVGFDNVRIPAENLLGEEGKGFKVAMAILNNGRTGLGGGAVGAMKFCIDNAIKQANERKQFDKKICEYGLVQEKIARMTALCFAAESLVGIVGHMIDSGSDDYSVEAAISKIFAAEALWTVANEALQIAGGNGFMREYPYERIVRDSRINLIFEGTNEILRLYVALAGFKEAGDLLKGVGAGFGKMLSDPIKGFGLLSSYAGKKITEITKIGGDKFQNIAPTLSEEAKEIELLTLRFSAVVESMLKKHGKGIVEQQFIQKRMAEVVIDLFSASVVISRVSQILGSKGHEDSGATVTLAKLYNKMALERARQHLDKPEREEDGLYSALSTAVVSKGRYEWDVV
jgi:alkylation response protein AidB-like acyl-CoA dehydrogenase